jgi:predicted membrane channel-forming protein YqfA (hemolysin III family)
MIAQNEPCHDSTYFNKKNFQNIFIALSGFSATTDSNRDSHYMTESTMTTNEWLSLSGYIIIPACAVLYALNVRFKSKLDDDLDAPPFNPTILFGVILISLGAVLYRLWESITPD